MLEPPRAAQAPGCTTRRSRAPFQLSAGPSSAELRRVGRERPEALAPINARLCAHVCDACHQYRRTSRAARQQGRSQGSAWGVPGFCSGSSGAASNIICAKIGQGAYLGLTLIHTKFEKKSRGLTDVRHKSRTRKFTKIASAHSPAIGGLYADPRVGPNNSDCSKPPQRRHSVGRARCRGRLRGAQMVPSGPIEPKLWPLSIYYDRMRWPTHVSGLATAIRRHRAGASTRPEMRHRMPQPNGPYCSLQPFHVVW